MSAAARFPSIILRTIAWVQARTTHGTDENPRWAKVIPGRPPFVSDDAADVSERLQRVSVTSTDSFRGVFVARVGVHDRRRKRQSASCIRWRTPKLVSETCAAPHGKGRSTDLPLQTSGLQFRSLLCHLTTPFVTRPGAKPTLKSRIL